MHKRLTTSINILALVFSTTLTAQNTDSLWTAWQNTSIEDEDRMKALMSFNEQVYLYNRPDTALLFADELYHFADSINNQEYRAKATNFAATANAILGNYDQAEVKFLQYLEMARALDDDLLITAALKNIGNIYDLKSEYPKAIEYFSLALDRAEKANIPKEIMGAQYGMSKVQVVQGEYELAIPGFERVLQLSRSSGEQRIESSALHQLVLVNQEQGDHAAAIEYGIQGLKIGETINDKRLIANFTNAIGNIYQDQEDYDNALRYYQRSLDTYTELGMKNGIAGINQNFAKIYLELDQVDKSISFYQKSLEIHEEVNDKQSVITCLTGISSNYLTQENHTKALDFANRALSIAESIEAVDGLAVSYGLISEVYYRQGQLDKAIINGNKGLVIASENDLPTKKESIAYTLYEAYKTKGNTGKALSMFETYNDAREKLEQEDNMRTVLKSTYQYESDKRAAIDSIQFLGEKKILSERNAVQSKLLFWSGLGLLVFLLLSYFIYSLYRKTKEQNEVISTALSEKDILLREIHHRVKNNLQLVSSLLTLQSRHVDDPKALEALNSGKSRVKSMALIHQNLYSKENLTGINVKTYLEKLCLELVSTYKIDESKISLVTEIEDIDLDIDTIVPLGLIINELITNALKYAFPNDKMGEIKITLREVGKELQLIITDDGIGLPADFQQKNSFGYKLITTLNEQMDGRMEQHGENGTSVTMHFKDYKIAS